MNRWDAGVRATRRIPPDDALGTALWLVGQGLWPVPITPPDDPFSPNPGKASLGRGWGVRRLSTRALFAIFRRHPRAGVQIAAAQKTTLSRPVYWTGTAASLSLT